MCDDYELCFEDEFDDEDITVSPSWSPNERSSPTEIQLFSQQSRLQRLPPELILGKILAYVPQRTQLLAMVCVSKHLKKLLYSQQAEFLWNFGNPTYHFCIDSYCPSCSLMMRKRRKGLGLGSSVHTRNVMSLLDKCPIHALKLHCFITDIPDCLRSLANPRTLQSLDLTLTNKSNSPPLEDLLAEVLADLASMSMDSNHPHTISMNHERKNYENNTHNNHHHHHHHHHNSNNPIVISSISEDSYQRKPTIPSSAAATTTVMDTKASNLNQRRLSMPPSSHTASTIHRALTSVVNASSSSSSSTQPSSSASSSSSASLSSSVAAPTVIYSTNAFAALTELSLDSSHLQHVNPQGRAKLLDVLGRNLVSLSFSGLSPPGVFTILSTRCPNLTRLRVDRATSEQDLSTFQSTKIIELELCRANFLLCPGSLNGLGALKSLRYSASFRCDSAHMESIVGAAPPTLESLSLEVSSTCVNPVLHAVSRRLHMIRQIAIQSSHETGHISEEALTCLGRQCLFLTSLDISSTKSVSDITFGASSFMRLATSFPSLTNLRIKYESATMMCMYDLLTQSDSLRLGGTIVLWERKKWMDASRWLEMEKEVSSIGSQFSACSIKLEDIV